LPVELGTSAVSPPGPKVRLYPLLSLSLDVWADTDAVVIWTKNNPTPWQSVKPDENIKLMSVSHNFEKKWVTS